MIVLSSRRAYQPFLLLGLGWLLLTGLSLCVGFAWAQALEPELRSSLAQIDRELELIHIAEQEHRPATERGTMWGRLALQYHANADFVKAEDAYNQSLRLLKSDPAARTEYAAMLGDLAALYLNYGRVDEAESVRKQALAVREQLGNLVDIGVSEVNLGNVAFARHQYKKAERLARLGIKDMSSSPQPPTVGMLSGLITVTYARCLRGHCGEGIASAQQAVAFANTHFASESAAVGFALETLGFAEWKNGAAQDGERDMRHAVQILRTKLASADPRLAGVLRQYADYLIAANRRVEAQEISDEVDRMKSQAGNACARCTVSVYSLSNALR